MEKNKLSIIMPVYNEEKNIQSIIPKIHQSVNFSYEILIIYDSDKDTTLKIAKEIKRKYKTVKFIKNSIKPGLIQAVKTGVAKAQGNTILVMSPDFSDDPKVIKSMYKKITQGYDIVSASRYSKGGARLDKFSIKYLLSKIAGKMSPIILGIPTSDVTNGFKMYKKKVFITIPIVSTGGWEFTIELMVKANAKKYSIAEVPTISHKRIFGKSKFKLIKWLPSYIKWYLYGISSRVLNNL